VNASLVNFVYFGFEPLLKILLLIRKPYLSLPHNLCALSLHNELNYTYNA